MKAKKLLTVLLATAAALALGAWLTWQLVGYAMVEFAKGGVC